MSFISDYLHWSTDNETPEMFQLWGGMTVLSSMASRRVWLPWDKGAIYAQLYTLLVGEAGSGKSVAMNFVKQMLAQPGIDLPYSGNIETHQGLLRFMAGEPTKKPEPIESPVAFMAMGPGGKLSKVHPMTIVGNEFTNFISADEAGWMNMLNDIFMQDRYLYRTKGQGTDIIEAPFICVLAGLPTEMSHDLQKQKVIASGFSRRTIFQFGERDWNNPRPRLSQNDSQLAAFSRCLDHLKQIKKLSGPFSWTPEADTWWDKWYRQHNPMVPKRPPQLRPWYGTKPDRLLQVAMLVSLSEGFTKVLDAPYLEVALAFLERMEGDLYRVFGGSGRNELAPVAHKIFTYISGLSEPIGKKQLMINFLSDLSAKNNMHKEFDSCLEILEQESKIDKLTVAIHHPTTQTILAYDILIGLPLVIAAHREKISGSNPPLPHAVGL